jgi:hypothetical protein
VDRGSNQKSSNPAPPLQPALDSATFGLSDVASIIAHPHFQPARGGFGSFQGLQIAHLSRNRKSPNACPGSNCDSSQLLVSPFYCGHLH